MPKPNQDDIADSLQRHRQNASMLFAKWGTVDSYIHGSFNVWDTQAWPRAASWEVYRPSLPFSIWSRARDRMTTAVPIVRRLTWGDSEERKVVADKKVEPWANAGLKYMMRCDPAFKLAWGYAMQYGMFVLEGPVLDPFWRTYDARAKTYWPARFHAPHPASVLLDPLGPTVPREVFQFKVMESRALKAMIAARNAGRKKHGGKNVEWENDDAKNPTVTVCNHWTEEYHSVFTATGSAGGSSAIVDASTSPIGAFLYTDKHEWDFVPFAQSPTGWGAIKKDASLADAWAQACTGVIDPIEEDLLTNAMNKSGKRHQFLRSVFASTLTQDDPGQMEQAERESQYMRANNPEAIRPLPVNEIKPFMENFDRDVAFQIQETSLANEFGGFGEAKVNTLGQQMMNLSEANKRFTFPKERLEAVCTAAVSNLFRFNVAMKKHYPSTPMKIMGMELTEEALEGDYNCEVEFRVVDPVLKMQNEESVRAKWKDGLIDWETAMAEMGYENIQEIRKNRLKDEVLVSPYAHAEALAEAAKELGLKQTEAQFRQQVATILAQMQTTGAAPPPEEVPPGGAMMAGETPTNPMRDLMAQGQMRRQENGNQALAVPPKVG